MVLFDVLIIKAANGFGVDELLMHARGYAGICVNAAGGSHSDKQYLADAAVADVRNNIRLHTVESYAVDAIPIHDHFLGVQLIAGLTRVVQIFNRDTKESQGIHQVVIASDPKGAGKFGLAALTGA